MGERGEGRKGRERRAERGWERGERRGEEGRGEES